MGPVGDFDGHGALSSNGNMPCLMNDRNPAMPDFWTDGVVAKLDSVTDGGEASHRKGILP